jgi:hypothetical protein
MSASAMWRDSSGRSPVETTRRSISSVRDVPTATCVSVRPGRGNQRTSSAPIRTGSPSTADAWVSSVALMLAVLNCERIATAATTRTTSTSPSANAILRATDVSSHDLGRRGDGQGRQLPDPPRVVSRATNAIGSA